ncbi:very-long-chain (3R)-3-hydroxyacyl-CoA dehydratase 3 [Lampetra fluviatilis]
MSPTLTPPVLWAQRHDSVSLKVDLKEVSEHEVECRGKTIVFKGYGYGAQGQNRYGFSLELLEAVETPAASVRVTQREVAITLRKAAPAWWARLTSAERRPNFVMPDFDRWMDESDAEEELRLEEMKKIGKVTVESRVRKHPLSTLHRGYLFVYNLVQLLGFAYVLVSLSVPLLLGHEFWGSALKDAHKVLRFCQLLALLEVVHPLAGLVSAALIPTALQVLGRGFMLFVVIGMHERLSATNAAFAVYYLWSAIEVFRYPYYMLGSVGVEWRLLTWIRYSLWIPLYPLGALAEAACVLSAIPLFEASQALSVRLPNALNSSVHFPYILYAYLAVLAVGVCINFRHMYKQRSKRFGVRKRKRA